MQEIQEYIPQLEIVLYDGKSLYIPADRKELLKKSINAERFIEINEMIINTREIKQIIPFDGSIEWTKGLSFETIAKVKDRIKTYKTNLSKYPSLETIYGWVEKATKGENL
jgi:hypothetical protein